VAGNPGTITVGGIEGEFDEYSEGIRNGIKKAEERRNDSIEDFSQY
jgi:hypothetical protein